MYTLWTTENNEVLFGNSLVLDAKPSVRLFVCIGNKSGSNMEA